MKAKINIESPCKSSWIDMPGDEKVRFCNLCKQNVYNTCNLSSEEVNALLADVSKGKRVCMRVRISKWQKVSLFIATLFLTLFYFRAKIGGSLISDDHMMGKVVQNEKDWEDWKEK